MTGPMTGPKEAPDGLVAAFRSRFSGSDWEGEAPAVLVALSGGLDSLVLLHLLRFDRALRKIRLHAAHFDHAMRPESGGDARWVMGLCRAWDVPLRVGTARTRPASEEEAREMRYEFLLEEKELLGADWLLTAHHADDQAETVLFRIFRGTGLTGLAGIPDRRLPGILRPLLDRSRVELEDYADFHGIRPRVDPTNFDTSIPRNFLRHSTLPQVERYVAPGARGSLLRLARLARENEDAWESLLPGMMKKVERKGKEGIIVVRSALLAYHPAVRGRILRHLLSRLGITLSEAGTRMILEFTRGGASGRELQLPGGLRFRREFDTFLLRTGSESGGEPRTDGTLLINGLGAGEGEAVLGGRRFVVSWGLSSEFPDESALAMDPADICFPLEIRGWMPGDRISLPGGGKKLKKLFGEAEVPKGARAETPILVDGLDRILWVCGVATSKLVHSGSEASFIIGIRNVDEA